MIRTITAGLVLLLLAAPAQAQEPDRPTLYEAAATGDAEIVTKTIRAKAAEDWPDDFTMQKFAADQQLEALEWLGENDEDAPEGVPEDVYKRILSKAAEDWADDLTMIRFAIEEQVEAYLQIHQGAHATPP